MFKQRGYDVKELPQDDDEPYMNCRGTLKVWRANGDELSLVSDSEQIKLFSGDCYIVQYSYSDIGRDEILFYAWFGRHSVLDDRFDAICHMSSLVDSIKGNPVMAQVVEDKEPVQFLLIFQTLIVLKLFRTFPNSTKYLKTIVSFGKITPEQKDEAEKLGLAMYSWEEFLILGSDKQYDLPVKKKTDICTIMYTSGTTGDPKGVLISNDSIVTLIAGIKRLLENVNEELTHKDVYLSYLPLAHIFDRVIEEFFISRVASIGFWRGDVKLLVKDLSALKSTVFCAVPRVLDRIYSGLTQKISSGGFVKKTMFNLAYSYKYSHMKKGQKHEEASPICDKVVFSKGSRAKVLEQEILKLRNDMLKYELEREKLEMQLEEERRSQKER